MLGRPLLWAVLTGLLAAATAGAQRVPETVLSRDQAVADLGQLADLLESRHPEPYGDEGKLAFHRRLHELIRAIPDQGISVSAFHALLQPFVAYVGDGHTQVQPLASRGDAEEAGQGMALRFRILANRDGGPDPNLYLEAGVDLAPELIGSRVLSIEGVPLGELIGRQRRWEGYENDFGNLQNLVWRLGSRTGLLEILPEWDGEPPVELEIETPEGGSRSLTAPLDEAPESWIGESANTRVELPVSRAGEPSWRFTDSSRAVAVLRLDNTWAYREVFESLTKLGSGNLGWARRFYESYRGEAAPADTAEVVAGLPSAIVLLDSLVTEMRAAGTKRLVVDLRRNSGGSSMLVNMILYYLAGRAGWSDFFGNFYTVRRLTPADLSGADSAEVGTFPMRVGDYDFSGEFDAGRQSPEEAGSETYWMHRTVSFADELRSSTHEAYYRPPSIVAVVAPRTFSGGFWVAASLKRLGAELYGVPSGQAGNAFANVVFETLTESGIVVGCSTRLFVLFPEEGGSYPVLPLDAPLTYEAWRRSGFDPNAAVHEAIHAPTGGHGGYPAWSPSLRPPRH